ncbi:MAG: hypothetical protein AB7F50_04540 [Fimbriimonadaceae bacterium]
MFFAFVIAVTQQDAPQLKPSGLHGYINASVQEAPEEFRYGVSLYSTAWPLLEKPIAGFQIGLASTWILPDNRTVKEPLVPHGTVARDSMPERGPSFWTVFQTIEGGLGFWASNRYFAPTAKFRINGSVDGYNHEVSTPGWDFYGRPLPRDWMGIAQLSPRLLIPPDGVTLAAETCGQLFGYAWMALPLIPAHEKPVKTGDQTWTMFLNTANFRGPVAFYVPSVWSKMSQGHAPAVGRGLDALPGLANSGAIEINTVPHWVSPQVGEATYHRIPQLQFPADKDGKTVLLHNMTTYSKRALWNQVEAWGKGGARASGKFDALGAFLPTVRANPLHVRQGSDKLAEGIEAWVKTATLDEHTFGLEWAKDRLQPWKEGVQMGRFPAFYRHEGDKVAAVADSAVPEESGLKGVRFRPPNVTRSYEPTEGGKGVWMDPPPPAGPFTVRLVDRSIVTYYWYRFIDQPAMTNAGLNEADRARLQKLVESMHREWTPDKEYMAPPARGTLASLDPAQLLTPPKGLEVGYVPIAVRQDPAPEE